MVLVALLCGFWFNWKLPTRFASKGSKASNREVWSHSKLRSLVTFVGRPHLTVPKSHKLLSSLDIGASIVLFMSSTRRDVSAGECASQENTKRKTLTHRHDTYRRCRCTSMSCTTTATTMFGLWILLLLLLLCLVYQLSILLLPHVGWALGRREEGKKGREVQHVTAK